MCVMGNCWLLIVIGTTPLWSCFMYWDDGLLAPLFIYFYYLFVFFLFSLSYFLLYNFFIILVFISYFLSCLPSQLFLQSFLCMRYSFKFDPLWTILLQSFDDFQCQFKLLSGKLHVTLPQHYFSFKLIENWWVTIVMIFCYWL